jgi:sec-independent protein translocase protein TatB
MLDFGFSEIVLTSFIALIVLGPEKLPKVARQVGNWMGRARVMARQLTEQLEREVTAEELLRAQNANPGRARAADDEASRSQSPVIAPPTAPTPPPAIDAAPPVANEAAPPVAIEAAAPTAPVPTAAPAPEPVYGLDASQTTAAAMHAADPPSHAANPAHSDTPAT